MQYLMAPLTKHYDSGFGATANAFYEAARYLQNSPTNQYSCNSYRKPFFCATPSSSTSSSALSPNQPSRMIVVIDHHAAHVYRDFGGSRPAVEDSRE